MNLHAGLILRPRNLQYCTPEPEHAELFERSELERHPAVPGGQASDPPTTSQVGLESDEDVDVVTVSDFDESHHNPLRVTMRDCNSGVLAAASGTCLAIGKDREL